LEKAEETLENAVNYSEYSSRPFLYIKKRDSSVNLHVVAEQYYPLIFKRLGYRSKKLVDSLVSTAWTDKCLNLYDPVLERQIRLFQF
jgi:hypothetical protein